MAPPPLFKAGKELPLLLETPHFIIINKPQGLASHPGPTTHDSVETSLTPQKRGGPWLAHRLDRDTMGCLLIARRKTALIAAQQAFAARSTIKKYWAIVSGVPNTSTGTITIPLKRQKKPSGWCMVPTSSHDSEGQAAHTEWKLIQNDGMHSCLELTLHTGRTHQARVHCAAIGHPILGDVLYNLAEKQHQRLHLLARSLTIPLTNETLSATAPVPSFMHPYTL